MRFLLPLLTSLTALALVACNGPADEPTNDAPTDEASSAYEYFGDTITTDAAEATDAIFAALADQDSVYMKVEGTVDAVCQKKGCWMTMPLGADDELFIRFADYGFFVPLNCQGRTAVMEGWAFKSVTTVVELKHYAEDEGLAQEEIDAITEPEEEYKFMADGVILK